MWRKQKRRKRKAERRRKQVGEVRWDKGQRFLLSIVYMIFFIIMSSAFYMILPNMWTLQNTLFFNLYSWPSWCTTRASILWVKATHIHNSPSQSSTLTDPSHLAVATECLYHHLATTKPFSSPLSVNEEFISTLKFVLFWWVKSSQVVAVIYFDLVQSFS